MIDRKRNSQRMRRPRPQTAERRGAMGERGNIVREGRDADGHDGMSSWGLA